MPILNTRESTKMTTNDSPALVSELLASATEETKLLPSGTYYLKCTSAKEMISKYSGGAVLICNFEVIDGEYLGHDFNHNFNYGHTSKWIKNRDIKLMKTMFLASTDLTIVTDVKEQLYQCDVVVQKGTDNFPDKNIIAIFNNPDA